MENFSNELGFNTQNLTESNGINHILSKQSHLNEKNSQSSVFRVHPENYDETVNELINEAKLYADEMYKFKLATK